MLLYLIAPIITSFLTALFIFFCDFIKDKRLDNRDRKRYFNILRQDINRFVKHWKDVYNFKINEINTIKYSTLVTNKDMEIYLRSINSFLYSLHTSIKHRENYSLFNIEFLILFDKELNKKIMSIYNLDNFIIVSLNLRANENMLNAMISNMNNMLNEKEGVTEYLLKEVNKWKDSATFFIQDLEKIINDADKINNIDENNLDEEIEKLEIR